jgi:hypothetical protein
MTGHRMLKKHHTDAQHAAHRLAQRDMEEELAVGSAISTAWVAVVAAAVPYGRTLFNDFAFGSAVQALVTGLASFLMQ